MTRTRTLSPRPLARRVAAIAGVAVAAGAALSGTGPIAAATQARAGRPTPGSIWILNVGPPASITQYAPSANGNAAPVSSITGHNAAFDQPDGLVATSSGALWVTQSNSNEITEYAPGAHGDVAPVATIAGAQTGLDIPTSIAIAQDGSLWVMNTGQTQQVLSHFAAGARGNVAPIATITGPSAGLVQTRGIALTPNDKHIWVDLAGAQPALKEFATSSHGNAAPVRVITGSNTMLGHLPFGIAVNASGEVTISADDDDAALVTFGPHSQGNASPRRTIIGAASHLVTPAFTTVDAASNLWTENYSSDSVVSFASTAHGNTSPRRFISGASTALDHPNAVAVYSTTPGAPRKLTAEALPHHRVALRWKAPANDGGGIASYAAYLMKSRHGTWSKVGSTTGTSLTIAHLSAKKSYRLSVVAVNSMGSSPKSAAASIS